MTLLYLYKLSIILKLQMFFLPKRRLEFFVRDTPRKYYLTNAQHLALDQYEVWPNSEMLQDSSFYSGLILKIKIMHSDFQHLDGCFSISKKFDRCVIFLMWGDLEISYGVFLLNVCET